MCQNYSRWKLVLSGKPWAFGGKLVCKRDYWGKNRAFVETQCDEGTLRKFGHSGEKIGLLGEMSAQKGHFCENWVVKLKTGLVWKTSVPKGLEVKIKSFE